ncbi:MAG: hypothetical protein COT35_13075 [Nitrospirae bacterium CG08_land_8_20_14_0_20_52_24]|nr:MAG: hypothetical protein COT35_13075 [Nitrospirae bacterium CG08_land_8_20_14_0_20_52_24]
MNKGCSSEQKKKKDAHRPSRNTHTAMGMVFFLSAVFLVFTSLLGDKSLFQLQRMQQEKEQWILENARQAKDNEAMKKKILAAKDDLFIVEKNAREELGMVKEDEVVYLFDTGKIHNAEQLSLGTR